MSLRPCGALSLDTAMAVLAAAAVHRSIEVSDSGYAMLATSMRPAASARSWSVTAFNADRLSANWF